MARKVGKVRAVNDCFVERVLPVMESWGLNRHPSAMASFGKHDHGYRYDFADLSISSDMKIAAFSILNPGPQLWIKGLRTTETLLQGKDVPIIYDNLDDVFTLTRNWSILRPMTLAFDLKVKQADTFDDAANRLMGSVLKNIHKLKAFLYG